MENEKSSTVMPGFWRRLANLFAEMEKTEMDYVWDNIHDLVERSNDMERRIKQIETRAMSEAEQ